MNEVQWIAYSEKEWEEVKKLRNIDPCHVPAPNVDVWRCPKCERVYVFEGGGYNPPVKYYVLHDIAELGENGKLTGYYGCKYCAKNKAQLIVYSDTEWIDWLESVGNLIDFVNILPPRIDVRSCSKCERVYIFKDNKLIKYYVLHNIDEFKN